LNLLDRNDLPKLAFQIGTAWGGNMGGQVVSFASIEVERESFVERSVEIVGGVIIFGLNGLQKANGRQHDFVEAWRNAMCLEIGAEEFEKFCLTRR